MKPTYLRIRNWEKFQHYKNRRPPWVRYHVETLDDYELLSLPYTTQLVYDRLLLLAARTDNNIPHDPDRIGGQTNIDATTVQEALEILLDAGFVNKAESKRSASKALARRKQNNASEAEAEAEDSEGSEADSSDELPASDTFKSPDPVVRLLVAIGDHADDGTERVVRKLVASHHLAEGDLEYARECCLGPNVTNRAKVAVDALKRRAERSAA